MLSTTFANDLLKAILNGTAIANLLDNAASGPFTQLHFGLATGIVGVGGDQTTNECNYTGYARVPVDRSSAKLPVTTNSATNTDAIQFGEKTAGTDQTPLYWTLGTASSGSGKVLFWGPIATASLGQFTAAVDDNFTIPGHGLSVDDKIAFLGLMGSTLPTGITEGTLYWVKSVSGDTITISATQGGSTIDITASGDGIAYKIKAVQVTDGIVPEIPASSAVIKFY